MRERVKIQRPQVETMLMKNYENQGSPVLSPLRVVINRAKKEQIQEERYTEIEKENRRLLEKMTGMLKGRKQQNNLSTRQHNLMDASVMTSDEISKIFTSQASPRIGTSSPQGAFGGYRRSLNREYRKKELHRISEENQAFLQRLQGTQAEIKSKKYESEYKKKIPVLRNLCEFPYVLGDYKASQRAQMFATQSTQQESVDGGIKSMALNHFSHVGVIQQWSQHQSLMSNERTSFEASGPSGRVFSANQSPRNLVVGMFSRPSVASTIRSPVDTNQRQAGGLDQNRIVHFKRGKYINGGYFVVEISTSSNNLFIAAFDVESPASFLISIPFPKAQEIIELFEHNFEVMAEYLSFARNKLVMLNPIVIKRRQAEGAFPMTPPNGSIGSNGSFNFHQRAKTTYNNQVGEVAPNDPNFFTHNNQRYQNMGQFRSAPWSHEAKRQARFDELGTQDSFSGKMRQTFDAQENKFSGTQVIVEDARDESREPYNVTIDADAKNGRSPNDSGFGGDDQSPAFAPSPNYQSLSNHTTIEIDAELKKLKK